MALLRYSRPGYTTTLVDIGPSFGRRQGIGGELVVGTAKPKPLPVPATTPERRAQMAEYRSRPKVPCGRWIILARSSCARQPKHTGSCTPADRLARLAAERRS